ncbi:hypothetical protein CEXT_154641 [Caerostris extrusa]|uniref:Uncharacterized protein n=1 Tax=Caerostris extrusa TaxID=172846 RepID=A0AAV4M5Y9_CAEEX|nr:hypothetical protein CEXT_154641 [Caerostris extrusa]
MTKKRIYFSGNPFPATQWYYLSLLFLNSNERLTTDGRPLYPISNDTSPQPLLLPAALHPADVLLPMIISYLRTAAPLDSQICRLFRGRRVIPQPFG